MGSSTIPVMKPLLPSTDEVAPYLREMDSSRIYSNLGPLGSQFSERLARLFEITDPSQIVLASSATVALEGICTLIDANRIFVPQFTFAASAHAAVRSGKVVEVVDIAAEDWQIDYKHLYPCPCTATLRVLPFGAAPKLNLPFPSDFEIIDAAASIGARHLDLSPLRPNQAIVFSLHATKVHGIGEGGVAVLGSSVFAQELRSWLNFGFGGSRISDFIATNGKMSEIAAAYGLAALDSRELEIADWVSANTLAHEISESAGVSSLTSNYEGASPYWIAQFMSASDARAARASLAAADIETRSWWGPGLTRMPAFADLSTDNYPIADAVASQTLGLPMFRDMTSADFDRISSALTSRALA